jgi:hypothetical protein
LCHVSTRAKGFFLERRKGEKRIENRTNVGILSVDTMRAQEDKSCSCRSLVFTVDEWVSFDVAMDNPQPSFVGYSITIP